jgi:type III restriction enzyme
VPLTALARITRAVDGEEVPIGKSAAEAIRDALVAQKMLEPDGQLGAAFEPKKKDFKVTLPPAYADLEAAVVDLLAVYQIERHVRKDTDEKPNRLKKEVTLSPDFENLWNRIKPKTTYRVEFETDTLVTHAVTAVKKMERIEPPKIKVTAGKVEVQKGGVAAVAVSAADEKVTASHQPVPDILAYLQNETELTRSTLVRILKDSGRLSDFLVNPQRFIRSHSGQRRGSRMGDGSLQERRAGECLERTPSQEIDLRLCRL